MNTIDKIFRRIGQILLRILRMVKQESFVVNWSLKSGIRKESFCVSKFGFF